VTEIPRILSELESSSTNSLLITPYTVHANYCDDKKEELIKTGVWLLMKHSNDNNKFCRKVDLKQTVWGKIDWKREIEKANKELQYYRNLPSNTTFRIVNQSPVFLLNENRQTQMFDSGEAFVRNGFQWNNIKILPQFTYFINYTDGPNIK